MHRPLLHGAEVRTKVFLQTCASAEVGQKDQLARNSISVIAWQWRLTLRPKEAETMYDVHSSLDVLLGPRDRRLSSC